MLPACMVLGGKFTSALLKNCMDSAMCRGAAVIVYGMRQLSGKHIEIVCVFRRERGSSVRV